MENSSNVSHMKKYVLIGVGIIAVVLVIALWAGKSKESLMTNEGGETPVEQTGEGTGNQPGNNGGTPQAEGQPSTHTASRITFDAVNMPPATTANPAQVTLYKFRPYDNTDVERMAGILGLPDRKSEGGATIAYGTTDPARAGWLMVDIKRGVLTYRNYSDQPQTLAGATVQEKAQTFLRDLDVIDDLTDCSITYQKTAMPDVTMVECHRDWQRTGLPILNFIGLVNVPETTSIARMQLGRSYSDVSDDPTIVNTSTGQDGFRRPDDFNTATVAIHTDGTVLGFTSNIRPISGTQQVAAADMISREDVSEKIVQGKTNMFFIKPQGSVEVDWSAFFATTTGTAARVTDLVLAYVEIPGRQDYLAPMYVARGTAQLGPYKAVFFAADPATRIGLSADTLSGAMVAGVNTTYLAQAKMDESLKLSTFGFVPGNTTDGTATGECQPAANQLYPLIEFPPFGQIGPFSINNEGQKRKMNYFLIPSQPDVLPEINSVVGLFDTLTLTGGKKAELREMQKLEDEWASYSRCPLRLTGSSPTAFVYGAPGTVISLHSGADVIYRSPAAAAGTWEATVQTDGSLQVNGAAADYLYYEYAPVAFNRPQKGWNVKRTDLISFAQTTLAPAMQLTKAESDRLVYEITRAAFSVNGDELYVAPIAQTETDARLPLTVSGTQNVVRAHFFVGNAQGEVQAPAITPVPRNGTMVLELGGAGQ